MVTEAARPEVKSADAPVVARDGVLLPDWTIVGFSGHRHLDSPDAVARGIRATLDRLSERRGLVAIATSTAIGADTLFLEEAVSRKLPYLLVLPFHRSRFQEDFDPPDWERVEPLFDSALEVEELGESETPEEAYMETGVRLVDRADVMVVAWDGQPARGLGGTGEVVEYARDLGKPLIIIDPATGALTDERLDRLSHDGAQSSWPDRPLEAVERQFEHLDQDAVERQPRARWYFGSLIVLHLLAAGVGVSAFIPAFAAWKEALLMAEALLLLVAVGLAWLHNRVHRTWIHSRIGAELVRSFLAVWHLRGHAAPPSLAGAPFLTRLYRSLRMAWYTDQRDDLDLGDACDRYLRDRVQDQMAYYRRSHRQARPRYKLFKWGSVVFTGSAVLFAAGALVLSAGGWERWVDPAKAIAIILPLASASVLSHVVAQDYGRRTVRYAEMLAILERAERRLRTIRTWRSLARVAMETEEELFREVLEWHAVSRFAGQAH